LCAVAYTILVDNLERYSVALFTVAGVAAALGGTGEMPDPEDIRAQFDEALAEDPRVVDPKQAAMRRVLGLREV
jgi:hypothetical protein